MDIEEIVKKEEEKKRRQADRRRRRAEIEADIKKHKSYVLEMINLNLVKTVKICRSWFNEVKEKERERFRRCVMNEYEYGKQTVKKGMLKNDVDYNVLDVIIESLCLDSAFNAEASLYPFVEQGAKVKKDAMILRYFFLGKYKAPNLITSRIEWYDYQGRFTDYYFFHHGEFSNEEDGIITWLNQDILFGHSKESERGINFVDNESFDLYKYIPYSQYLEYKQAKEKVFSEGKVDRMSKEKEQNLQEQKLQLETQREKAKVLELEKENLNNEKYCRELEKQNRLNQFPLESHLDTFIKRLDEITEDKLRGDKQNKFFTLYLKLKEVLQKTSKIPLEQRASVSDDIMQINEIEALMDFYGEKIKKVKQDESLDDEEREDKISYWKRLRDKQITELEGA